MTLDDVIVKGAIADIPVAGVAGRLFFQTDSPNSIYRDNGSTWDELTVGSSGGFELIQEDVSDPDDKFLVLGEGARGEVGGTATPLSEDAKITLNGNTAIYGNRQHTLATDYSGNNVLTIQNTNDTNAFSAIAFNDSVGGERGAVGYGNPDGSMTAYPYQSAFYLEASQALDPDDPPADMNFVTTGKIGGTWFQYGRMSLKGDGSFYVHPIGTWTDKKNDWSFKIDEYGSSYMKNGRSDWNVLEIRNANTAGFSGINYKSSSGTEYMAMGYANSSTGILTGKDYIIVAGGSGSTQAKEFVISQYGPYPSSGSVAERMRFMGDGHIIHSIINDAAVDTDLAPNQMTFQLDETLHQIVIRVRYSGGTLKTGVIPLT